VARMGRIAHKRISACPEGLVPNLAFDKLGGESGRVGFLYVLEAPEVPDGWRWGGSSCCTNNGDSIR